MTFVGLQPRSSSCSRATKLALNLLCFVLLMSTCHCGGVHGVHGVRGVRGVPGNHGVRGVGGVPRVGGVHGVSRVPVVPAVPAVGGDWASGLATWYGSPTGGGSDGGACGYTTTVGQPPFSNMIAAIGPALFEDGLGCGECFEVKCTHATCTGTPVRVTATDKCPECEPNHFDLSGAACGAMAKPGQAEQLRNVGRIPIEYQRVDCKFPGVKLAVKMDSGANPYYFSAIIEYPDEDGALQSVELQQAGQSNWVPLNHQWGAVWVLNGGSMLQAPLSLRLIEAKHKKTIVLKDVIPKGWQPGQTYHSDTNF